MGDHQIFISKLYDIYKSKGFISEDEALVLLSANNFTLAEMDSLLEKLLSMGVIFADDNNQDVEDAIDKSRIDYNVVYNEILIIKPNLGILVDFIRNIRPPQNREWRTLIPQANNGNEYALKRLFEMYLRVVLRIALNYHKEGNIDLDDAIQEGTIGLMRALKSFDPTKHENLSSYVPLWINQHIDRAVADTGRTIRIPVHMLEVIKKFQREVNQFRNEYERDPTDNELAQIMEVEKVELISIKRYSQVPLSLNEIVNQELDGILKDIIVDRSPSPFELASKVFLKSEVYEVLETLKPKEREILIFRMGLLSEDEKTLEEVGKMFNVTRERIRQIEAKALRKLSKSKRLKTLID